MVQVSVSSDAIIALYERIKINRTPQPGRGRTGTERTVWNILSGGTAGYQAAPDGYES